MTTQVVFKIDNKLKKAAQIKAKKDGISLADLYKSATRSYIDGNLEVGLIYYGTLTPNAKTGRELMRARREIKAGKNISKPMNLEESIKYLRNLK